MTTTGKTSDNEWQRVIQQVTTNDSEWYNEWKRIEKSDFAFRMKENIQCISKTYSAV